MNRPGIITPIILSLIWIFSLFSAIRLQGQDANSGSIKGRVAGRQPGTRVDSALVVIPELNLETRTDSLGIFTFISVPAGNYTIIITRQGFLPAQLQYQSVIQGKMLELEVVLEEDVYVQKTVDIRSFRYENNRFRPISTFSFSRDEISLNPGAQGDILRAIGVLPGVTSSGGIYSAIAVRGQGVRDNVYMVDDIPVTEVGHLEGNSFFNDPNGGRFSIFAPRVIDHAVFQGGAFGPEYGRRSASALSLGIKEGNRANAIVDGQIDLLGVTVNYDGPAQFAKKTSLFISARYQNFYPLVVLVGLRNLGLPTYGDLVVKSTTELNSKNKLNLLFMVCPERFVRDVGNVQEDKDLNLLYLPDFRRNKIIAGVNLRTVTGLKSVVKNVLYFTSYTSDVSVGKAFPSPDSSGRVNRENMPFIQPVQTQKYAENKLGYRGIYETSFTRNDKLIAGVEADVLWLNNDRRLLVNDTNYVFRRRDLMNPALNYQVVTPAMVDAGFEGFSPNISAFFNYMLEVSRRLNIHAGARYDYTGFSRKGVVSPRINVSYNISSNHSVSVGAGVYYQDPVYSDIADLPDGERLRPEKSRQLIISYKAYVAKGLKLMIEGWYKEFSDLVVSTVAGSVFRTNSGTGYGRGVDISLTKRLSHKWHGIVSYSFMDVWRNDHDGFGKYRFTFSQPHQAIMLLSYQLNKRVSFSGKYRIASGRPAESFIIHPDVLNNRNYRFFGQEILGRNQSELPYFSSLDLRFNYSFFVKRIRMTGFMDVVNVLNRQIANAENFNAISGKTYYDGLAIFPSGGLRFEF